MRYRHGGYCVPALGNAAGRHVPWGTLGQVGYVVTASGLLASHSGPGYVPPWSQRWCRRELGRGGCDHVMQFPYYYYRV